MNLFQSIFLKIKGLIKPREGKRNHVTARDSPSMGDESFLEWLGIKRKSKSASSEVTYFTCMKMLSETIAKMPIKFYQKTENGVVEPKMTEIANLLRNRPNPFQTPSVFWNTVELNRNHFGNGYVYVRYKFKRSKYGGELIPLDMWIMPSNCVQVLVDNAGIFAGAGRIWYKYTDSYSGQQYIFGSDEVLHFKTSYSFDGITGLPVRDILKNTITGAIEAQTYMNNLYESGLTAKATLEYTGELGEEAKRKLVAAFEEFGSGSRNTGRIIPVPLGMKLTPLDISLTDSQFFELRKHSALQIAGAFGIKPNQINDYEKSSYANSEMQQLAFYVDTVLFILKQYEEEISYKLLTKNELEDGYYFKFNEKVLLRTDSKTQAEIFKDYVNNGIYMPNEVRQKLDLTDAPGGDKLIVNGNYIPITDVGKQYGVAQAPEDENGTAAKGGEL